MFPVIGLPLLFALAIGVAVKPADPPLLSFLSVLAVIWMGASLSLMSIVDEREVYDHERLFFLRIWPYVGAKTLVLWLLCSIQTTVFLATLSLVRGMSGWQSSTLHACWPLFLVGPAGVGLGLCISAVAGRSRPIATSALPLAMMAQIVFSVQVAGNGQASFEKAYGEFNVHKCQVTNACPLRPVLWTSEAGFTCCEHEATAESKPPKPEDVDQHNAQRPNRWAALASYFTLSRYGDVALRSLAYSADASIQHDQGYKRWRTEAVAMLMTMILGLPALAALVLRVQGDWWALKVKLALAARNLKRRAISR